MYNPKQFQETRLPVLHLAIAQARLAILVSLNGQALDASHVPVHLEPGEGPKGTLYGHLAAGNPQPRNLSPSVPALAIFQGPDAYVTPSWYPSKAETGQAVPTWNYVAIHATGRLEFFTDAERLRSVVTKLTERHETGRPHPWAVSDAPPDYLKAQLGKIVGFRLAIERLEGKWKLSQNRTESDRQGVIAGLGREEGAMEKAVAQLMKEGGRKG